MKTDLSVKLSKPQIENSGEDLKLRKIFTADEEISLERWQEKKLSLKEEWRKILGQPSYGDYKKEEELIDSFEQPEWTGKVFLQTTGPNSRQKVLLMGPLSSSGKLAIYQRSKKNIQPLWERKCRRLYLSCLRPCP